MAQHHSPREMELVVNGKTIRRRVGATTTLIDFLRDDLHLTGSHVGCDTGQCGACTVHLDGRSVKACTMLARQAEQKTVTTIEALAQGGALNPLQDAFRRCHALQCGFCTPGMIMRASDLLTQNPAPGEDEILAGLKGNLCRCTGYENILRAMRTITTDEKPVDTSASDCGIGASPPRREDRRFLTGTGRFTADISFHDQAFAVFVRSPHAHARILNIDSAPAKAIPGVLAVYTGKDVQQAGLGSLRCGWQVTSKDGTAMRGGERPILATDKVRFQGDALAVVIADSLEIAERAAQAVIVEFDRLDHNVDPARARTARPLHQDASDNRCFTWALGDEAGVERAFNKAAHITTLTLRNNRLIPNAIEPRAANATFDLGDEKLTLYTTSQNPHMARRVISETVNLAPEHKLRVVSPDVGGGFGSKIFIYPEECVCLWSAKQLGRPVKWVARRSESFLTDAHGRDHVSTVRLGLDADGRFTGLSVKTTANLGAYLSTFAAFVPTFVYGTALAGPYKTPAIYCEVDGVYTNTAPVDAYRGAGRPEAVYLLETVIDQAARDLGMDPVELRRRNLISTNSFPYQTPVALEYDNGDYERHLDAALDLVDYKGFAERRRQSQMKGRRRGIGVSCFVEACGIAPSAVAAAVGADVGLWESASLRFSPSGTLQLMTGSHSHGQGHETTFAQIAADMFAMNIEDIDVIHGDTDKTPMGMGTYGSRSLAVGGAAIVKAGEKIIAKAKIIASHLLDTAPEDVAYEAGVFRAGTGNRTCALQEITHAAYVPHDYPPDLEPGLEETVFFDPENFSYPSGTHICEVEIEPTTGDVSIEAYVAVDDFGQIVNPQIVEGQVHGGVLQGLGQALMEEAIYDQETGSLITDSLRTYALPQIHDTPPFTIANTSTPCTHNPLRAKGCGEAGAIAAPPAIMNAITNAIEVRIDMPATPDKIWRTIHKSEP